MSHSEFTPIVHLPIFHDDDKPTWTGDINDMSRTIDARFLADEQRIMRLEQLVNELGGK